MLERTGLIGCLLGFSYFRVVFYFDFGSLVKGSGLSKGGGRRVMLLCKLGPVI